MRITDSRLKSCFNDAQLRLQEIYIWANCPDQSISDTAERRQLASHVLPTPAAYTASMPFTLPAICTSFSSTEPLVTRRYTAQPWAEVPKRWHRLMAARSACGFQSESWMTAHATPGRSVPRPQQLRVCMKMKGRLHTLTSLLNTCALSSLIAYTKAADPDCKHRSS